MRRAVLDLGSNSSHAVADVVDTGAVPVARARPTLRLGPTVARHECVPPERLSAAALVPLDRDSLRAIAERPRSRDVVLLDAAGGWVRARHVHHVTPGDVGERVSVRRVLDRATRSVGDVLGTLLAYDEGVLLVDGRDGPVSIDEQDVLASRIVPPPPPPRPGRTSPPA